MAAIAAKLRDGRVRAKPPARLAAFVYDTMTQQTKASKIQHDLERKRSFFACQLMFAMI